MPIKDNLTQNDRFKQYNPITLPFGLEKVCLNYCEVFNVYDIPTYLDKVVSDFEVEIEKNFVVCESTADSVLSSMAEFVVWHLLVHNLQEFEQQFAKNGKLGQWLSTGSPNFIDIFAVRKTNHKWRFYAIEVKWSENCNYYNQVRQGLVEDLIKLYRADYSSCRLGTHVTSLKNQLRPFVGQEKIEEIFSDIDVGDSPSDTTGVEYWGIFVSDWSTNNVAHDPDDHFLVLSQQAVKNKWSSDCVKGIMLNIQNGRIVLRNLAMGKKV